MTITATRVDGAPPASTDSQGAMKDVYAFMSDPANLPELKKVTLARISDNEALITSLFGDVNLGLFSFELPKDRVDAAFGYLYEANLIKEPMPYDDYVVEGARS